MPLVVVWDNSISMQRQLLDEIDDPDGLTSLFELTAEIIGSFLQCLRSIHPNQQIAVITQPCSTESSLSEFTSIHENLLDTWKGDLSNYGGVFDVYSALTPLSEQFQKYWMSSSTPLDILIFTDGGSSITLVNPVFELMNKSSKSKWSKKITSHFTICSFHSKLHHDLNELKRSQSPFSRLMKLNVDELYTSLYNLPANDKKLFIRDAVRKWSLKMANDLILGVNKLDKEENKLSHWLPLPSTTAAIDNVWISNDDCCFTVTIAQLKCIQSNTCYGHVHLCPPILLSIPPQKDSLSQQAAVPVSQKWIDKNRNDELEIEIVGFLNQSDLKAPHVSSRHVLWPTKFDSVNHKWAASNAGNREPHFLPLIRLALVGSPQLTALCMVNPMNKPLPLSNDAAATTPCTEEPMRWAFLTAAPNKLPPAVHLFLLPEGVSMVPWLGKLSFLAPISLFDTSPYRDDGEHVTPFPVCSSIRMSYSPHDARTLPRPGDSALADKDCFLDQLKRSWVTHTTWMNPSTAANEIVRFVRMCRKMSENSIAIVYKEINRIRVAACVYAYEELLDNLVKTLQIEHNQFNSLGKSHAAYIISCLTADPCKFIDREAFKSS